MAVEEIFSLNWLARDILSLFGLQQCGARNKTLTLVNPENKTVTQFFQTKGLPAVVRNDCDYVLRFTFGIVHSPGCMNTGYESRSETNPCDRFNLKTETMQDVHHRNEHRTTRVWDDAQFFLMPEKIYGTENETSERKSRIEE